MRTTATAHTTATAATTTTAATTFAAGASTTAATSGLRRRLGLALASLGVAAAASLATAAPASAGVQGVGSSAQIMSTCANGVATMPLQNQGFDYVRIWKYDHTLGWVGGSQWQRVSDHLSDLGPVMASQAGWFAVYAEYADWLGDRWDVRGEWVSMMYSDGTQGYWCR